NGERRAPRASWTAERFVLLQKLNNIEIVNDGDRRPLTPEERDIVLEMAYSTKELKYHAIRRKLALPDEARFAGVPLRYMKRKEGMLVEDLGCENSTFVSLSGYHELREFLTGRGLWEDVKDRPDLLDDLAYALTVYKTEEDVRRYLTEQGIPTPIVEALASPDAPSFDKVIHLSIKAMRKIIPHLEQGLKYDEACAAAGYSHYDPRGAAERTRKLPVIEREDITSPVTYRALCQARKVVNHIIDRYGPPTYVNIELARDIGKSAEKRKEIEKLIEQNTKARQEDDESFRKEFGCEPTGERKAKWRLYREQNFQCAYTGKPFDKSRLFEPGYAEIDHILPYSRSLDNRFSNRVLVFTSENRNKGDRTPYEYFGADPVRWAAFEEWVKANIRDRDKRANLLRKDFAKRQDEWMQRSLTDTQYTARFFSNYVRRHLAFADPDVKQPVRCLSGAVTALARSLWGLSKHREEDDLHHALDAAVIAVLTPHHIQSITEYSKERETGRPTEIIDPERGERDPKPFGFRPPWEHFRKELLARLSDDPAGQIAALNLPSYAEDPPDLSPVIVSRMQIRKASGALHAETIRSMREAEGKRVAVVRRKLTELTKADLDKLCDPQTNRALYAEIRRRMEEHEFDAKKAFAEPLHKPSAPGKKAPVVCSVKV
ncbi:MAG: type II CRISPR RNA-guided endonuclease Cas9, partial [Armatimonadota bacterium]